jgi:hypothetical protein
LPEIAIISIWIAGFPLSGGRDLPGNAKQADGTIFCSLLDCFAVFLYLIFAIELDGSFCFSLCASKHLHILTCLSNCNSENVFLKLYYAIFPCNFPTCYS